MDILHKASKTIMRLDQSFTLGEFKRAGTLLPGEDKAQGHLINVYKYLTGGSKDGARLFSVVCTDRRIGNQHKLKPRKFQLCAKKHSYCDSGVRQCPQPPSVEIFKTVLDTILSCLPLVTLPEHGSWAR